MEAGGGTARLPPLQVKPPELQQQLLHLRVSPPRSKLALLLWQRACWAFSLLLAQATLSLLRQQLAAAVAAAGQYLQLLSPAQPSLH